MTPPRPLLVIALIAGGLACVVLQALTARLLHLDAAIPDLALGVVLYAALRLPPISGGLVALTLGYFGDLTSGGPRGLEATAVVAVALLARTSTVHLLVRGPLFVAGFVAAASLLKSGLMALLLKLAVRLHSPSWTEWLGLGDVLRLAAYQAALTGLLAPVSFAWARRIHQRWMPPRSSLVSHFEGPLG